MKSVTHNNTVWTSLVLQWLRVHLPMQGTWTRALVWEYPTCHGATPFLHHSQWAHVRRLWKPTHPRAMRPRKGSLCREQPEPRDPWGAPARRSWRQLVCGNEDLAQPEMRNKQTNNKFKKYIEVPFQSIAQIYYYLPVLEIRSPKWLWLC